LRSLTLSGVTGVGLKELAGLEHLQSLEIISTTVTDEA
jgi:hypothetical protein